MNATASLTERPIGTVAADRDNCKDSAQRQRNPTRKRVGCIRLNSRARRKILRQHGMRRTIIETCGIMPLTESEAEGHRQRVKTQFFAQLEEWERTPPGLAHFLLQGWKFPAVILGLGVLAGFLFGAMFGWVGLAAVLGFGGWLREAINEAAKEQRIRHQSAQRIHAHAKWKIQQEWTSGSDEMFRLLEAFKAPVRLQTAVLRIGAIHKNAEFKLEVFDEDPILRVRKCEPGIPPEQYVLGAWGLPEKFTFR